MKCVYVAGKMSSADPLDFLRNLNRLQEWTARVREQGFAPFPVADDYADIMRTHDGVTMAAIKEASSAWLLRADAVFVSPDWEGSPGTLAEIEAAQAAHIPVFYDLAPLCAWRDAQEAGMTEGAVARMIAAAEARSDD